MYEILGIPLDKKHMHSSSPFRCPREEVEWEHSHVLHVVVVRPLATHSWEDAALFLSERFPVDNDQSLTLTLPNMAKKMVKAGTRGQTLVCTTHMYIINIHKMITNETQRMCQSDSLVVTIRINFTLSTRFSPHSITAIEI